MRAGEDTDYYKKPVFLTPVKEGPFYALKVGPALLAVPGGLRTNNDFQCLDAEGAPIEGLYALGNVMGDICAVDYPINVAGNSHGRCITYGYLLGHEPGRRVRSPVPRGSALAATLPEPCAPPSQRRAFPLPARSAPAAHFAASTPMFT